MFFSEIDFAISKALLEKTFFFSFSGFRDEGNSTTFVKIDQFNLAERRGANILEE